MIDDRVMRRLRAARPAATEPAEDAALFARIVAAPGDPRVAEAAPRRSLRPRRGVLAGGTLALAGAAAAVVVALSGSTAPPAFAISRNDDGSVLVNIEPTSSRCPRRTASSPRWGSTST